MSTTTANDEKTSGTVNHISLLAGKLPRVGSPNDPPKVFSRVVLEQLDTNLFLARKEDLWQPTGRKIVFGGQVIGQSLAAASKTVKPDKTLHSCHCYFLIGGKAVKNIIYNVMSLQEGRSFASRLVTAQQDGRAIFICICSFQNIEMSSLVHQYVMPICPSPEHLISAEEYFLSLASSPRCSEEYKSALKARASRERENVLDIRFVLIPDPFLNLAPAETRKDIMQAGQGETKQESDYPKYTSDTKQLVWVKTRHALSDNPHDHMTVLGYVSDLFLLSTAVNPKANLSEISMIASRDHSIWFHCHDFRMDEWMLFDLESPRAGGSRGLAFGRIFKRNGELAVSLAQEGVVRLRRDQEANQKLRAESSESSKL